MSSKGRRHSALACPHACPHSLHITKDSCDHDCGTVACRFESEGVFQHGPHPRLSNNHTSAPDALGFCSAAPDAHGPPGRDAALGCIHEMLQCVAPAPSGPWAAHYVRGLTPVSHQACQDARFCFWQVLGCISRLTLLQPVHALPLRLEAQYTQGCDCIMGMHCLLQLVTMQGSDDEFCVCYEGHLNCIAEGYAAQQDAAFTVSTGVEQYDDSPQQTAQCSASDYI